MLKKRNNEFNSIIYRNNLKNNILMYFNPSTFNCFKKIKKSFIKYIH